MPRKIRKSEINQKLREIEDSIDQVEQNLPSNLRDFLHLGLVKEGIYKKVEFSIENVIHICNILNSDLSLGVPTDEDDIISNLEVNKILSKKLIDKIGNIKGFRNILVHRYGKIDDEIAFELLQNNLDDFDDFKKEILGFLHKAKNKKRHKRITK